MLSAEGGAWAVHRLWLLQFVTKLGEVFYLPGPAPAPCPLGSASPWSLSDHPVSPFLLPPPFFCLPALPIWGIMVLSGVRMIESSLATPRPRLPFIDHVVLQLCSQKILVECRLLGSP